MEDLKMSNEYSFVHLFSPASLRIGEEDWKNLVQSDFNLATEVGLLLIKSTENIETVLEATEKQFEEQRLKADYFENQVKHLNSLLNKQAKAYASLDLQVEDLTVKYRQLLDDCRKYKDNNKALWGRIDCLESECDEYLMDINKLTGQLRGDNSNQHQDKYEMYENTRMRNRSLPDENTHTFSTTGWPKTYPSITKQQRQNEMPSGTLAQEIEDQESLKAKIELLEKQIIMLKTKTKHDTPCHYYGNTNTQEMDNVDTKNEEVFYTEPKSGLSRQKSKPPYFQCFTGNEGLYDTENLPTVRHYHDLFAEIFEKLKATRISVK